MNNKRLAQRLSYSGEADKGKGTRKPAKRATRSLKQKQAAKKTVPTTKAPESHKFAKLIAFIKKHPGLDAMQLSEAGWDYFNHGSLADAHDLGLVEFRKGQGKGKYGGWYVAARPTVKPRTGKLP